MDLSPFLPEPVLRAQMAEETIVRVLSQTEGVVGEQLLQVREPVRVCFDTILAHLLSLPVVAGSRAEFGDHRYRYTLEADQRRECHGSIIGSLVVTIDNLVTGYEFDHWLLVLEHGFSRQELRIRKLWRHKPAGGARPSDNRKNKTYVHRPNLAWWREREFSFDMREEWQTGRLGGVYGDNRDPGYVIDFRYDDKFPVMHLDRKYWIHEYTGIEHIILLLRRGAEMALTPEEDA